MKQTIRRAGAVLAAAVLCGSLSASLTANAAYGVGGNGTAVMEYLDRGIYAVKSGTGMFVSWRWNANDSDTAEFRLYRDDTLIYTSKSGDATSFYDSTGSTNSKYRVDTVSGDKVIKSETCKFTSGTNYFDIPLDNPNPNVYSPNDCCAGDADGDGQYEIFLKWDPNDSQDNSKTGYTSKVFIDCYTLTGKKLWRIDLGRNIRAGQHYTQMGVADFDGDGCAELITKTCDGTVDGTGKVIGNANANYVSDAGTVLTGPEYLTLFEGATGAALDTIDFPVPRGDATSKTAKNTWGDDYGNRCERYNCAIAYLDGVHPSCIYGRGYYTRMTLSAVDVVNKKLSKRWVFDTGFNSSAPGYGDGNHNVMVADVDDDGKQEVCMGSTMIDDNGKVLWCTNQGHGDAMHLGDLDPDRPGQELWLCHEGGNYGVSLIDAKNGQIIFHKDGDKDTGRCCADNVWAGNKGAELWGARPANTMMNVKGDAIGSKNPAQNFLIYWDGDLERELLDGITITKVINASNVAQVLFTADGCESNNGTKAVPCMTADLFGDWREELVLRTSDNTKLRIWCTTSETDVRLTTLMHDMQYRMQNGCQQSSYNQPPHVSYYLGSDAALPARPNVIINGQGGNNSPASVNTNGLYALRNLNSGKNLGVSGDAADGTAIVQTNADDEDEANLFTFEEAGDCVYVIHSAADDSLVLAYSDSGALTLVPAGAENTQFELYRSGSGYHITPAGSEGARCVEVANASSDAGAKVQLWEDNGHDCQKWSLNAVSLHPASAAKYCPGDLNDDGKVNAVDFSLLKSELMNSKMNRTERQKADLNADGKVTLADAVIMQKFLLTQGKLEAAEENKAFYYAIDAAFSKGIEESSNAGFTETAYVNLANEVGSALTWKVYVREAGSYACTFRFANGGGAARPMTVSVNGGAGTTQDFATTGDWTVWAENGMTVTLKEGMNTIKLTSETADGGPNFDWLKLAME